MISVFNIFSVSHEENTLRQTIELDFKWLGYLIFCFPAILWFFNLDHIQFEILSFSMYYEQIPQVSGLNLGLFQAKSCGIWKCICLQKHKGIRVLQRIIINVKEGQYENQSIPFRTNQYSFDRFCCTSQYAFDLFLKLSGYSKGNGTICICTEETKKMD